MVTAISFVTGHLAVAVTPIGGIFSDQQCFVCCLGLGGVFQLVKIAMFQQFDQTKTQKIIAG